MTSKEIQKAYEINQLRNDIQEIQNFLSGMFDRSKAIDILRKHILRILILRLPTWS